jgi:hypothetical protein
VSTQIFAIVTTVGSSSVPGWPESYGTGDFFLRRFREGFCIPVSALSSDPSVGSGLGSGSGAETPPVTFFLGEFVAAD